MHAIPGQIPVRLIGVREPEEVAAGYVREVVALEALRVG
jgi:hypothetical protein